MVEEAIYPCCVHMLASGRNHVSHEDQNSSKRSGNTQYHTAKYVVTGCALGSSYEVFILVTESDERFVCLYIIICGPQ